MQELLKDNYGREGQWEASNQEVSSELVPGIHKSLYALCALLPYSPLVEESGALVLQK